MTTLYVQNLEINSIIYCEVLNPSNSHFIVKSLNPYVISQITVNETRDIIISNDTKSCEILPQHDIIHKLDTTDTTNTMNIQKIKQITINTKARIVTFLIKKL